MRRSHHLFPRAPAGSRTRAHSSLNGPRRSCSTATTCACSCQEATAQCPKWRPHSSRLCSFFPVAVVRRPRQRLRRARSRTAAAERGRQEQLPAPCRAPRPAPRPHAITAQLANIGRQNRSRSATGRVARGRSGLGPHSPSPGRWR